MVSWQGSVARSAVFLMLHSIFPGGADLKEAFEGAAVALFDYMTELDHVDIDPNEEKELEVEGSVISGDIRLQICFKSHCYYV
jgi:hypothetical protein